MLPPGGCAKKSTTPNFKFYTSPLWNLSVGVLNASSRIFSAFAAILQMQHPPAKHKQHNQNQPSDRFSHPTQRRQHWRLIGCTFRVGKQHQRKDLQPPRWLSHQTVDLLDHLATHQGTTLPSCLCHLCLCPLASEQALAGTWELAVSQLPPFGSLPSCDHTRHTRNSCLQTSLTCLSCLSPCRLSCLPWSWQGRPHPWATLPTHFACRNFSIVGLCFSGESMDEACTAK